MAKRVFFSFHYENDVSRANVVRNSWVTQGKEAAGFIDKAEFEKIKQKGDQAVYNWIDEQLKGTSVTVILIGEETLDRKFVQYEIQQSYNKGNAIIGVKIGNIKNLDGKTTNSQSHIKIVGKDPKGNSIWFDDIIRGIYDYKNDDGYNNLGKWINEASSIKI